MEYTYKIIRSSIDHNVMEVEFSATGQDTVIVGMPLPVTGQNYLEIIQSYAPIHQWARSGLVTIDVPVGEIGTLVSTAPTPSTPPESQPAGPATADSVRIAEIKAIVQSVLAEISATTV